MRQSDGSEILGPNDPRNIVIGIISVSPGDDRQSVINAITSQDKLGRDQIVLVLPAQNKSFKSEPDFVGLHQMAAELEATIVLVAPQKSKIANLARKESFTVYGTMEELTAEEFPPLDSAGVSPAGVSAQPVAPMADDEMEHTQAFPLELPETPPPPIAAQSTPVVPADGAQTVAPAPVSPVESEDDEDQTNPSLVAVASPVQGGVSTAATDDVEGDGDQTNPSLVVPGGTSAQPTSYLPAIVPAGTSAVVPSNPRLPVYYEPIDVPRRRSWRGLIITGVTILVLIGLFVLFYRPVLNLFFPPTATVTITPASQQLTHTYQIIAVLGVPDPTKDQVDARALYADSQTQTQTVKTTGQGHIAGQQARGELTFYNTSASTQTISAGTIVFDANGVAVVNEQTVTLPAFNAAVGAASMTVSAHTVNVGSAQNIPAYDFSSQLCCSGSVYVTNAQPFTGGQDAQTFSYVQQSDIDGVEQSMNATLAQQATMALQGQVRANERPVGAPRCSPQVQSNHSAGERASTVTVSVTTSCVGEVYDMQAVQILAARKLSQDAATNPGAAYAPVGSITTQVTQATPDIHGNVLLITNASGIWAYQFTTAQTAHFANLIAGRSSQDARSVLLGQTGVQGATIALTGVGVTTVPNDTNHITINIEAVQGLHG